MGILLDTVTVSELRRPEKADSRVVRWQEQHAGEPGYLSVITLNEIRYGVRLMEARDPVFAKALSDWYIGLTAQPEVFPVVAIDREIAEVAGVFRADHRMAYHDSLIGATAHVRGLALATRNVADFEACGIPLVNPWEWRG